MSKIKPTLKLQRTMASGCFYDDRSPKQIEADRIKYTLERLEKQVAAQGAIILAFRDLINKYYPPVCQACEDRYNELYDQD